jgi:hypothetical protein
MQQQVNFLQQQFRERTTRLPSILLLQAFAAIGVTMLLIFAFAANRVGGVGGELRVIAGQEAAALERLENLRGTISSVMGEKSWAERLDEATANLKDKQASLNLISGTRLGDSAGFSQHLKSLARQSTNGLWLTNISLSALGDKTWLQGKSARADLVPVYLQDIADEEPFEAQRFYRLNIDRDDDDANGIVTFVVSSDASLSRRETVLR